MSYSPFFQTLHDEVAPVGHLGRGTHYSVLRAPTWHDNQLRPLLRASVLDIAIIWDEDHDTRVVEVVQEMYFDGLLSSALFIGERKGSLTILLDPALKTGWGTDTFRSYVERVQRVAEHIDGDAWTSNVDFVGGQEHSIISDEFAHVSLYLNNIQMLWQLGTKPYAAAATGRPLANLVATAV